MVVFRPCEHVGTKPQAVVLGADPALERLSTPTKCKKQLLELAAMLMHNA
jgi:hypothetical protein